jgi:hypothetical protein
VLVLDMVSRKGWRCEVVSIAHQSYGLTNQVRVIFRLLPTPFTQAFASLIGGMWYFADAKPCEGTGTKCNLQFEASLERGCSSA